MITKLTKQNTIKELKALELFSGVILSIYVFLYMDSSFCSHSESPSDSIAFIAISIIVYLLSYRLIGLFETDGNDANKHEQKIDSIVFARSSDGILITDENNRIVTANQSFLDLIGYSINELEGQSPRIFSSGKHEPKFFRLMWESINATEEWIGTLINKNKSGEMIRSKLSIGIIRNKKGEISNFVSFYSFDTVNESVQSEKALLMAYTDSLTGLPNRALLLDRIKQSIAAAKRNNKEFALLFMDLNRFKLVNDTMGHGVGDKLLQSVALRIKNTIRESDTAARLGGDEFVVVLNDVDKENAGRLAENLTAAIARQYAIDGIKINTQASIGIAMFPLNTENESVDKLLKNADLAMYVSKKTGKIEFYRNDYLINKKSVLALDKDIREAIQREDFYLEFQPQLNLATNRLCGVEALIRWSHSERGVVSPGIFIPVAEETNSIIHLGEWVLRKSCNTAAQWYKNGFYVPIAVNVSAPQITFDGFLSSIESSLNDSGLPPSMLEIEITEGVMINDVTTVIKIMESIRLMGVKIAIDDFGTGFSSLSYIKKMPVNKIKIDKSFVSDIDTGNIAIVESIISLGHRLGFEVIAEGVETSHQIEVLKDCQCDQIQGFNYATPLKLNELMQFFTRDKLLEQ